MAAVAAAAAVVGAGTAVYSASQAHKGTSIAQETANTAADRADPAAAQRPFYQQWLTQNWDRLSSLNPAEIMKDPSFRFLQENGMRDINNKASSDGTLRSGTVLEDMSKFNQDLSSTYMDKQFARNMSLMGQLGNFSGLNIGNPGVAGQVTMQGGLAGQQLYNNGINQLGGAFGALSRAAGNYTGAATPTSAFTYNGTDAGGGPAYG